MLITWFPHSSIQYYMIIYLYIGQVLSQEGPSSRQQIVKELTSLLEDRFLAVGKRLSNIEGALEDVKAKQDYNHQKITQLEEKLHQNKANVDIKDPAVVPLLDAILTNIYKCRNQGPKCVDREGYAYMFMAQVFGLLPLVPDDEFLGFLDKIRAGQYNDDSGGFETRFLELFPFNGRPGALSEELAAGEDPSLGPYISKAMLLLTRPTLRHITALAPIFGMPDIDEDVKVAASKVLNRYTAQNVDCENEVDIKDPAVIPLVDALLTNICKCWNQGPRCIDNDNDGYAYKSMAQVFDLLPLVPDDEFLGFLAKIRAGQYCDDSGAVSFEGNQFESRFLELVPFSGEPGALKIISQELAAGRNLSLERLFSRAMLLLTRPTLRHITALAPIFGMADIDDDVKVAASKVLNRYCSQNVDCDKSDIDIKDPAVVPLIDAILTKICKCIVQWSQCAPQDNYAYMAQIIEHIHLVPDDEFLGFLDKIRAGQYCDQYSGLESQFLLFVPYSGEPGALAVISQEYLRNGWWYSSKAMILLTRPTLSHVTALAPIFGMPDILYNTKIAIAVVVNRYCSQNIHCDKRLSCIQSVTQDASMNQTVISVSRIDAVRCTQWDDFEEVINAIFPESQ